MVTAGWAHASSSSLHRACGSLLLLTKHQSIMCAFYSFFPASLLCFIVLQCCDIKSSSAYRTTEALLVDKSSSFECVIVFCDREVKNWRFEHNSDLSFVTKPLVCLFVFFSLLLECCHSPLCSSFFYRTRTFWVGTWWYLVFAWQLHQLYMCVLNAGELLFF